MERHAAGFIALLLIFAGGYLWVVDSVSTAGPMLKVGWVLAIAWLAWPEVARMNPSMVGASVVGAGVVFVWPKLILVVLAALLIVKFLGPKKKDSSKLAPPDDHRFQGELPARTNGRRET